MARAIDDLGHLGRATKPLGLRVYEPGSLPDPMQCAGSLILINDRADGTPRPRLALSNGASWDLVALTTNSFPAIPQTIDLTPIIQRAVAEQLPALAQPAPMRIVSPPASSMQLEQLKSDNISLTGLLIELTDRIAILEDRLMFVEAHAATTGIELRTQ